MTDARRDELRQMAEAWTGMAVLLSPLPYVGDCISDFCHRRAGKFYQRAFGPLSDAFIVNLTTLLEQLAETHHG